MCNKPCSLVPLDNDAKLNKDVQRYFSDVPQLLKKVGQAVEFQRSHIGIDKSTKSCPEKQSPADNGEVLERLYDELAANYKQLKVAAELMRRSAPSLGVKVPARSREDQAPAGRMEHSRGVPRPIQSAAGYANTSQVTATGRSQNTPGLTPFRTAPFNNVSVQTQSRTPHTNTATRGSVSIITPIQKMSLSTPGLRQGMALPEDMVIGSTPMPSGLLHPQSVEREVTTFGQQRNPFM